MTIVNVAVIASRRKFPDIERPFTVPAVPWIAPLAVVANIVLLFNVELTSVAVGIVAEFIGVAVWFTWEIRPSSIEWIERETQTGVAEYTSPG